MLATHKLEIAFLSVVTAAITGTGSKNIARSKNTTEKHRNRKQVKQTGRHFASGDPAKSGTAFGATIVSTLRYC